MLSVGRGLRVRFHFCGIAPDVRLGEGECRDLPFRHARQKAALLLFGSKEDQGLRHADGLMGGEQRGQIPAVAAQHHRGAAVIGLRKAQALILDGHFNAEGAELRQAIENVLRDFARAIDFIGVHVLLQKSVQPLKKGVALIAILRFLERIGMQSAKGESAP